MKTMQRVILSIFMDNYRKSSQTDASVCSYWDFLQCTLLEAADRRPARHKETWWWNDIIVKVLVRSIDYK